jgi:glutamate N-acetyltransferase/amino-acid N-acetyltransferase
VSFDFIAAEVQRPARMSLSLIELEHSTPAFGAVFTRNAFPGAPVTVGRARLQEPALSAVVINNKVSNVCAPHGIEDAEAVCDAVARALGRPATEVLPSSTGVIGWRLPVAEMVNSVPALVARLSGGSVLSAAEAILTTDLYPKIRSAQLQGGRLVGFAKGAGMVEPNLATMLVYLLTDLDVPRAALRAALTRAVDQSFNCMSVDSDTSTSDTVMLISSRARPLHDLDEFSGQLLRVCSDLAEDVVRNGEGVHHVLRVRVSGAPSEAVARGVGKSIVNSPLFQCAVCGNDANVGRLVMAVGKYLGAQGLAADPQCVLRMGGEEIFSRGEFRLNPRREERLVAHLKGAELYASIPPTDGLTFRPRIDFPPHERSVELEVVLGTGQGEATVLGADRSHEYISENADYRS